MGTRYRWSGMVLILLMGITGLLGTAGVACGGNMDTSGLRESPSLPVVLTQHPWMEQLVWEALVLIPSMCVVCVGYCMTCLTHWGHRSGGYHENYNTSYFQQININFSK